MLVRFRAARTDTPVVLVRFPAARADTPAVLVPFPAARTDTRAVLVRFPVARTDTPAMLVRLPADQRKCPRYRSGSPPGTWQWQGGSLHLTNEMLVKLTDAVHPEDTSLARRLAEADGVTLEELG